MLKESTSVQEGEVIDAAVMRCRELQAFYEREIKDAKAQGVLLSLHLKATMMKVSDPIMFGHAVRVYYKEVFDKHVVTVPETRRRTQQRNWRRVREDSGIAGGAA